MLDAAAKLDDLAASPRSRLEWLRGDQAGRHSIRVNDQMPCHILKPMGIRQVEAARRLGISLNRLNEIVLGKRGIAADTALRLSRLLKASPQFWMRLSKARISAGMTFSGDIPASRVG